MKHYASIIINACLCIIIIGLLLFEINSSLERTKNSETALVNHLFEDVVKKDRNIRIEGHNRMIKIVLTSEVNEDSLKYETATGISVYGKQTDSLSIDMSTDDKEFIASQLFLIEKIPIKASVIDSMLQVSLRAKGIIAQTAVSYYGKHGNIVHKEISTLDGLPPSGSLSLSPLNLAIPAIGFEIKLEGYVKYPLGYLWEKTPNIAWGLLIYITLFTFFALLSAACIMNKRRSLLALHANCELIQEIESSPLPVVKAIGPGTTEEIPEKSDAEIQITDELFINKYTGEIRLKNEIVLQLKEYRFKLFLFLLDGPDYCQTNEKIKEAVWQNKNTSDATVNKTAGRLRIDLNSAAVPIMIKNIRATGYQIKV